MKILILHLSDVHIKDDNDVNLQRIEEMIKSLNVIKGFSECIIVFSGDLANSGTINEYKHAEHLIGNIISKIKKSFLSEKQIYTLIVPGNHDINLGPKPLTRQEIVQMYNRKEIDSKVHTELKKLEAFFQFANRNKCFLTDKILDTKVIEFNGYRLGVNLINSAIFSTEYDDKGIHYIPSKYIDKLYDYPDVDIMLSVSHHSYEWFNQNDKNRLDKALYKNSSIIFFGHEHEISDKKVNAHPNAPKDFVDLSAGGILNDHKSKDRSDYYAKVIDTEENILDTYSFSWDSNSKFYEHKFISKDHITKKAGANGVIRPSDEFVEQFLSDEKNNLTSNSLDYFVFPRLVQDNEGYSNEIEICDSDKFLNEIEINKKIILVGTDNSGKTTLLKHLFMCLSESKITLFFNADEIKNKKTNKVIKYAFEEQYSEEQTEFSKFQQMLSSDKVAIIDDINTIREQSLKKLIDEFTKEFSYIIMTTKAEWDFDIVDNIKKKLNICENFSKYKLNGFYSDKRQELIRKVCAVYIKNDADEIEEHVKKINNFIKNQISLFNLTPDFIIQYIKYFFSGLGTASANEGSIFSKVFEINVLNSIKGCTRDDNIDVTLVVLDKIAYYIHFKKRYPLSYFELEKVVNEYNIKYDKEIKIRELLRVAFEAKILKQTGDNLEVKFSNKNLLAFFVARELIRKYYDEDEKEALDYILNNICFGINSDIILFVSYLTSNTRILNAIYIGANEFLKNWNEFSIDKANVNFLNLIKSDIDVVLPANGDKENIDKLETKAEKETQKDEAIETIEIYDYNEVEVDSYLNKLIKAVKYTEIIAKILPNFEYIMQREDKQNFVKSIYSNPNKIIYYWAKYIDDNWDDIIKEIKELSRANNKELSDNNIAKMLEEIGIATVLTVYDGCANFSADKKTIKPLNEFNYNKNINYRIQNIMILENLNDIDKFIKKVDDIYENDSRKIVKLMAKMIVRKCLICHENMGLSRKQHLTDKYFSVKEKRGLLLSKNGLKS